MENNFFLPVNKIGIPSTSQTELNIAQLIVNPYLSLWITFDCLH
jgi:hypothetical protein